ncbi:MAG: putative selenate reductase subunit YgfK [Bacteroidales bacterium]|nr:putative selenate reductase subunit YgfK [Bacteroidales bacterium]
MTDKFSILPLRDLLKMILHQIDKKQQFFGIPHEVFFRPFPTDEFRMARYGKVLETPVGIAAGPHTQLAQNIVGAWLCGARFIELKTVQTLDELHVSKPCIDMQDEGYNCEWSQELKITESYDQYLNAWIIIHILRHKFGWTGEEPGFIFNMSVGYDLKGIMQKNVQWFFEKMNDCSYEKSIKISETKDLYPDIRNINIPNLLSDSITLSTMHGCPPEEIEKIGHYLLEDKKLHTAIKLNPTLLGKDNLINILNNSGFKTEVPDEAFEHDLKYPDAVSIIKNLQKTARKNDLCFGLKLTNTLESINNKFVFPKTEKQMYMSGRALHPISINLANKLQNDFDGKLDISFSAGVNVFNVGKVISCGLVPATVCTDILKPGGYGLIHQYLGKLKDDFRSGNATSIDEYILYSANENTRDKAILKNLGDYSKKVHEEEYYKKTEIRDPSIKTGRPLTKFDCIQASCVETCPTHQDIPDYLYFTANGDKKNALLTILNTNPFPFSTGMVCDHLCQTKCTRINYDHPVLIREIKRFISEKTNNLKNSIDHKQSENGLRASIIGGGPSGLSCGYFLRLAGFRVDVYEGKDQPGGMVSAAIPSFRLTKKTFLKDVGLIISTGVNIHYNQRITKDKFKSIRKESDFVYVATGAPKSKDYDIKGVNPEDISEPLDFLIKIKKGDKIKLGKNIIIVGGGNTAMDTARTVYRIADPDAKITILYRRTIDQMPADSGEIKAVLKEGINIQELVLPVEGDLSKGEKQSLTCIRMKLTGADDSGRPWPIEIPGSEFEIPCDTLLPAIGQEQQFDFVNPEMLKTTPGVYETKIPGVFIGGDALRGASTAINAIGDGRKVAQKIINKAQLKPNNNFHVKRQKGKYRQIMIDRMRKIQGEKVSEISLEKRRSFELVSYTLNDSEAKKEAARCLKCDELCNTCVTVCPNFALYPYYVEPESINISKLILENGNMKVEPDKKFIIKQSPQIIHIADWCNECGNCTTFCPTAGAPYKVKPHLYLNKKAFDTDDDCYYFDESNQTLKYKQNGVLHQLKQSGDEYNYLINDSEILIDKESFSIKFYKIEDEKEIRLEKAAEMSLILTAAKNIK